jgi:hypothetical protein
VRDHLGGLTSGEAPGRSGVRPRSSSSPPAAVLSRPPSATMTTSSTPSGNRRRVGPAGRTGFRSGRRGWPPSGSASGSAWRLACCRNAWIRSTGSSTRVANRWWPAAVALPGVEPVTLGSCCPVAAPARRAADPARPGSALGAGSLPFGRYHRGRGAALQPDPGVKNPLTRYAPVCVLDCPAHRRSLTPCERTGGGCDASLRPTRTNRPPRARPSWSPHDRPDLFGRRWRE